MVATCSSTASTSTGASASPTTPTTPPRCCWTCTGSAASRTSRNSRSARTAQAVPRDRRRRPDARIPASGGPPAVATAPRTAHRLDRGRRLARRAGVDLSREGLPLVHVRQPAVPRHRDWPDARPPARPGRRRACRLHGRLGARRPAHRQPSRAGRDGASDDPDAAPRGGRPRGVRPSVGAGRQPHPPRRTRVRADRPRWARDGSPGGRGPRVARAQRPHGGDDGDAGSARRAGRLAPARGASDGVALAPAPSLMIGLILAYLVAALAVAWLPASAAMAFGPVVLVVAALALDARAPIRPAVRPIGTSS